MEKDSDLLDCIKDMHKVLMLCEEYFDDDLTDGVYQEIKKVLKKHKKVLKDL